MEKTEQKGIFTRIYDWFNSLTLKSLLGTVLLAFVILIILISISFLPSIFSKVSSSFSAALYSIFVPAEGATMTANKNLINSGEDFTINFKKGDAPAAGLFAISYACNNNVTDVFSIENAGLKKIECDTSYYLLENETSITIKTFTNESVTRLAIEGVFENNDTQKKETVGVIRVTIKNDSTNAVTTPPVETNPVTTNTNNNTPTYVPPTITQPTYYGQPDLAVRILQVGILSGNTIITNQSQFNYSDMVGIRFEVRNDGTAVTGPWNFTAILPSLSTPTYSSNTQISLKPGDSIIFTLGFSNLTNKYSNLITINVDPQNIVAESAEYNNMSTQTISNLTYNSNYYNNNNNYNNSGCYINGIFTYNCGNNYNTNGYYDIYGNWISYNNYNYNDWNYNYNNLFVSCYALPDDPETGDRVRWYADVSGGDGDYEYDWTGTNSLDSSSENPYKTYNSTGTKRATVTVTDGNDNEASATCTVYVD
jgi:hypothetical protein